VVRLTADDGYSASRWYSIASAPDDASQIELTVQRMPRGEVSTFLHDEVMPGDELEVRGPIGGWFVWRGDTPALLIGGGSGVVPLMAMLRLARRLGISPQVRLVVSVRAPRDLYYSDELPGPETAVVYTRQAPSGYPRPPGHITEDDIGPLPLNDPVTYICGSATFAEAATSLVLDAGVPPERIRIERFGPTG
jgi:ferredoxin-NADP reductase